MSWLKEWKKEKAHHEKTYDEMKQLATFCWACGRGTNFRDRPPNWYAPWLIHRAHIVNQPRLKDRRVVNLLCPLCHINYDGDGDLKLEHMITLKAVFDPKFFDIKLLQHCSIRKLPSGSELPIEYLQQFHMRKGLTRSMNTT